MSAPRLARLPLRPGSPMAAHPRFWGEQFAVTGEYADGKHFAEEGDKAVVEISGPLAQRAGWFGDSYDAIRVRVEAALASSAKEVVLCISSPGGDFAGSIELARELRAMSASAGKPIVSFTDSQALSAGYILACAGEKIYVTPTAYAGSIGVWAPIIDETARDKAMGLNVVIVASGTRKTDSNPHVAITEDAVTAMQTQVDAMAAMFFDFVAECRGLALSKIVALQGSQEFGNYAVKLGLADKVVNSWGAFLTLATGDKKMGKSYEEAKSKAREGLAKVAEGDDEDAKAARALLAKMDGEEPKAEDGDEDKKDKKEEASASASDEDKEKAADDSEDKKAADDSEEKKAAARAKGPRLVASTSASELALVERVHALEVERATEKETAERNALLAKRPDFSAEVRTSLLGASVAFVKNAVAKWPRGSAPAAAANAAPTRGDTQKESQEGAKANSDFVGLSTEDFIDEKMGLKASAGTGVTNNGTALTLGYMSPAQVEEAAKKLGVKGGF